MRQCADEERHHGMAADGRYHDNHDIDDEQFLRCQRIARRESLPQHVDSDDSEQRENCIEEERDEVEQELRLNHLRGISKPIGVPDDEQRPHKYCAESDARSEGSLAFSHYCLRAPHVKASLPDASTARISSSKTRSP